MSDTIKIKRRGEDEHRVISIRISSGLLEKIDAIADESNRSRNELINIILEYGTENTEII